MIELYDATLEPSASELTRDSSLTTESSTSMSPTPKHRSQRTYNILENIKRSSSNLKAHHARDNSAYTGQFTHLTQSETQSSIATSDTTDSGMLQSARTGYVSNQTQQTEEIQFEYPDDRTEDYDAWTAHAFYPKENSGEYQYPEDRDVKSFPYRPKEAASNSRNNSFHTTENLFANKVKPFVQHRFDLATSSTEILPYLPIKEYSSPSVVSKNTRITQASTESWEEETEIPSTSLVDLDSDDESSECSSVSDSEEEEDDYQSFLTDTYADGPMDGPITAVESFLDDLGENEGIIRIGNFFDKLACSQRESYSPEKHDLDFEEDDTDDETHVSIKRQTRGRSRSPRSNSDRSIWTAHSGLTEADTILEVGASGEEEQPSLLERVLNSCCDAYLKGTGAAP